MDGRDMYWYERDGTAHVFGNQESVALFNRLNTDMAYKVVERTRVGEYVVQTVWLGVDFGQSAPGSPLMVFETMAFKSSDDTPGRVALDPDVSWIDSRRYYPTEDEARAGHEEFVTLVRATAPQE